LYFSGVVEHKIINGIAVFIINMDDFRLQ